MHIPSKSDPVKVAVLPWHRPSLANAASLYKLYAACERLDPYILVNSKETEEEVRVLVGREATINHYFFDQVGKNDPLPKLTTSFVSACLHFTPSWVRNFLSIRRWLAGLKVLSQRVLERSLPDLLIVEDDRRLGALPLIFEAKKRGCKIMAAPYGMVSTREDLVFERQGRPTKQVNKNPHRFIKKTIARFWPGNIIGQGREKAFYYSFVEVLALRSLSMLPAQPFVLGHLSDLVVAGGKFDSERIIAGGTLPEKMVVTGEIEDDELAFYYKKRESIHQNLIDKYGIKPNWKTVIVCIPQDQPDELMPLDIQNPERRRMIQAACGPDRNTLVSLHPKLEPSICKDLVDGLPAQILEEPLKEVLAIADLYISNHSSTVRWSIMLQVPTLVVDFNGKEERLFDNLAPALEFCEMDELSAGVSRLLNQPYNLNRLRLHQKKLAGYFGQIDGGAGQRIVDASLGLIGKVAEKPESRQRNTSKWQ